MMMMMTMVMRAPWLLMRTINGARTGRDAIDLHSLGDDNDDQHKNTDAHFPKTKTPQLYEVDDGGDTDDDN